MKLHPDPMSYPFVSSHLDIGVGLSNRLDEELAERMLVGLDILVANDVEPLSDGTYVVDAARVFTTDRFGGDCYVDGPFQVRMKPRTYRNSKRTPRVGDVVLHPTSSLSHAYRVSAVSAYWCTLERLDPRAPIEPHSRYGVHSLQLASETTP